MAACTRCSCRQPSRLQAAPEVHRQSAYRQFVGMPFDVRPFFAHMYHHPEDISRGIEWLQTTFIALSKLPGPAPKMTWDQ